MFFSKNTETVIWKQIYGCTWEIYCLGKKYEAASVSTMPLSSIHASLDKIDEQLLPYNEITRNAICVVLHLEGGSGFHFAFVTGLCRETCINQPHTHREKRCANIFEVF